METQTPQPPAKARSFGLMVLFGFLPGLFFSLFGLSGVGDPGSELRNAWEQFLLVLIFIVGPIYLYVWSLIFLSAWTRRIAGWQGVVGIASVAVVVAGVMCALNLTVGIAGCICITDAVG